MTTRAWTRRHLAIASIATAMLVACEEESYPQMPPHIHYKTSEMVFFDSDSALLKESMKKVLAKAIADPTNPLEYALRPGSTGYFCVVGHSDNVGSAAANEQLGMARARSVADYLATLGIARDRILVRSVGSRQPVVITPPETAEPQNRRAEFLFNGQQCEKME
jgi:outer membrane protein OmpA-like peptidoglycan-associated protein